MNAKLNNLVNSVHINEGERSNLQKMVNNLTEIKCQNNIKFSQLKEGKINNIPKTINTSNRFLNNTIPKEQKNKLTINIKPKNISFTERIIYCINKIYRIIFKISS